jgi:pSer/pThr/pTyr-binding forkhead associated (FHA) protein
VSAITNAESDLGAPLSPNAKLVLPDRSIFELGSACRLGRSVSNEIRLKQNMVSRNHAHIYRVGNRYQVVDNHSTNGTYLNGKRISRPAILREGDCIQIGEAALVFRQQKLNAMDSLTGETDRTLLDIGVISCWILVGDIVDSSRLAQSMDDSLFGGMISDWFLEIATSINGHGGELNKSTGDGFLAFWREADGVNERIAETLDSLRKLQFRENPDFRLSLHYGDVALGGAASVGEEQLSGPAVHFAFRMDKAAKDLERPVLISASACERLGDRVKTDQMREVALNGFDGLHVFHAPSNKSE